MRQGGLLYHALWQTGVGIHRFSLSCRNFAFSLVEERGALQPLL
jgi:hypothetical protein